MAWKRRGWVQPHSTATTWPRLSGSLLFVIINGLISFGLYSLLKVCFFPFSKMPYILQRHHVKRSSECIFCLNQEATHILVVCCLSFNDFYNNFWFWSSGLTWPYASFAGYEISLCVLGVNHREALCFSLLFFGRKLFFFSLADRAKCWARFSSEQQK